MLLIKHLSTSHPIPESHFRKAFRKLLLIHLDWLLYLLNKTFHKFMKLNKKCIK